MIEPPSTSATHSDGDSDSDWDDDDDFVSKKINIRIKPIVQLTPSKISASLDELRATVGTWKSMASISLVKPNSRRSHHQSTLRLDKTESVTQLTQEFNCNRVSKAAIRNGEVSDRFLLPVAFAIQECLNVRILMTPDGSSSMNLIGRVKMAVPPEIITLNHYLSNLPEYNLQINIVNSKPWSSFRLNEQFVQESFVDKSRKRSSTNGYHNVDSLCSQASGKLLSINMKAVHDYAEQLYQKQPKNKYFLLPELLNYTIRSHEQHDVLSSVINASSSRISPINAIAHWLCDLNITKVRVDFEFLDDQMNNLGLSPDEIKNVKMTLQVNGGVVSHLSKPASNWSPIDSRLTWSFSSLDELIQKSTVNGVTSCLARFDLNDGPSTPSDVSLQFSISGKTLSGTQITLESKKYFQIVKQKFEVRTGIFRCEPPSL